MGSQITLTKTIFVVERQLRMQEAEDAGFAVFVSEHDEDDPDRFRAVTIDTDLDLALGSPDIITVSLQPGDTLNGN